ncbi:MAG TPA: hypothetical protein VKM94_21850 [Blastocatellia bacterium]|nr:hypothetical protein [Blastocatellia bacterium]
MKKLFGILLLVLVTLATGSVSLAGTKWINRREHNQQVRIREGIRDGELTRREAERLEAQQARIRVDERFARADGHLSYRERRRLDRELDRASRDIYRQKHDGQHQLP